MNKTGTLQLGIVPQNNNPSQPESEAKLISNIFEIAGALLLQWTTKTKGYTPQT